MQSSILHDLESGEEPITLSKAVRDTRLCIDGRPHDVSWAFRAATRGCRGVGGKRVKLETITQAGRLITTRSAIGRFVAGQAGIASVLSPQHSALSSTPAATKRRLAAAGL